MAAKFFVLTAVAVGAAQAGYIGYIGYKGNTVQAGYIGYMGNTVQDGYIGYMGDTVPLTCNMPGVNKFSSNKSPRHFYQCDQEGIPTLMECPGGKLYHTKTQECLTKAETKKEEKPSPVDIEAMGRNFQLGTLYDGKKNQFYPEASLWNPQTIEEQAITDTDIGGTEFDIITERTTKDKMEKMHIQAELTMDFLSGMVTVSGAGRYLSDTSERDDEANIALTYREITHSRRLNQGVKLDHSEECSSTNPKYTHVVTEVQYGMRANFEFRRLIQEHESMNEISGELDFTIRKIPAFSASGAGSVNLTSREQELLNTTSLKMYGDFSNSGEYPNDFLIPTSFDEGIDLYTRLPLLTGDETTNFKGTTIMVATLSPITLVCTDADYILNEISNGVMTNIINMLNQMDMISMKVGGLLKTNAAQNYLPIRQNLNMFKVEFEKFNLYVKKKLQEILPNVRGGTGNGEVDLTLLYTEYIQSPFHYNEADSFLVKRTREINAIESLTSEFPMESNIAVVDFESANDVRYVYSFKKDLILELYILTPSLYMESYLNGTELSEDNFWYNDDDTLGHISKVLNRFQNFALDNVDQEGRGYLVNLLPVIGKIGDSYPWKVKALVTGDIITEDFIIPKRPKIDEHHDPTHNSFKFWVNKPSEFVTGCKVNIEDLTSGETIEEVKMIWNDIPVGNDAEIVVDNLTPSHLYSFTANLVTLVGTSPPSEELNQLLTAPASPPERFSAMEVTSSSIRLEWGPPLIMAEGLTEQDFKYNIVQIDEDEVEVTFSTTDLEATFTSLKDASRYTYEIKAVTKDDWGASIVARTSLFSSPLTPNMKSTDQIWEHRATVTWDPPAKIPSGSTVLHYILSYCPEGGSQDDTEEIVVKDTWCDVTDLAQDQQYLFKVKVVTSEGTSDFSEASTVTTSFIKSDLDAMKDDIRDNVLMPMLNDVQKDQSKQLSVCAYQESLGISEKDQVVPFEETYLEKNDFSSDDLFGQGFFIPPVAGTYQFSYKVGQANFEAGDGVHIFKLFKNSDTLKESWSLAKVENANAFVPLSGTIIMELFQGDMVMLVHESQNDPKETAHITLCIQLLHKE